MAFFRRSSSLLRSTLTRLYGQEQQGLLQQQHQQGQQASTIIRCSSLLHGARFMCSVPSTKLFVGGLSWGMDENALREAFVSYGEVVEAKVVLDRETGRSKGFGFVSFTCTDHAEAAMKGLDGTVLSGRPLRVNFAIEKQRSFGSFGGFGSGGSSFGSPRGDSSYGNSGFDSGSNSGSLFNDSFSSGDSNQGGSSFFSNDSFGQDSFGSASNNSSGNDSTVNASTNFSGNDSFGSSSNNFSVDDSAGKDNSFFGKDVFDEPSEDSFGRDENLAQGSR